MRSRIKCEESWIIVNNTFSLVERSTGMHVLPFMYVLKAKYGGSKVIIVAKGFRQVDGVGYHEIFAPVVNLGAVCSSLHLVDHVYLELYQMDFVTAFLNGYLDEYI